MFSHVAWCPETKYPVLKEIILPPPRHTGVVGHLPGRAVGADFDSDSLATSTLVDTEAVFVADEVKEKVELLIGSEEEKEHALLMCSIPFCRNASEEGSLQYHSFFAAHYAQAPLSRSSTHESIFYKKDSLKGHVFFVGGFSSPVYKYCAGINNAVV